ncbi:MAG TPA: multicopper oxidase domain-containing protein [Candidatus Limnocylindrales bacterium]
MSTASNGNGSADRIAGILRAGGPRVSRRNLLRATGLGALGAGLATLARSSPLPGVRPSAAAADPRPERHITLAATDGFIYVPGNVPNPSGPMPFLPDPWAEPPQTMWGFGFRDMSSVLADEAGPVDAAARDLIVNQRGHFQAPAPMISVDEREDVFIRLMNIGLTMRPDLTDSHTIHWHGFRNAIPLFDGVPELSIAVPIGRDFTYFYRPQSSGPGTYMYHCHFEDVEHVSMGMTGIVFVRPEQNHGGVAPGGAIPVARWVDPTSGGPLGYAYNDALLPSDSQSTAYDREYGLFLSEAWARERFNGVHIQEHDWSDYEADIWLLNGRSYPDTLAPNGGGTDPLTGELLASAERPELQYQPLSSLIQANAGDRILLRFVNLGFQQQAMTIDGLRMRVVGRDATLLRGRDGTDQQFQTNTIHIGPGESFDVIVTAPLVTAPTTYLLYNRNLAYLHTTDVPGLGGQMTEIRVYPAGTLDPQTEPNT